MPSLNVLPPSPPPAAPQPAAAAPSAGTGTQEPSGERFADTLDARMKAPADAAATPAAQGGQADTAPAPEAPAAAEAEAAAAALALLGALTQQSSVPPALADASATLDLASEETADLAAALARSATNDGGATAPATPSLPAALATPAGTDATAAIAAAQGQAAGTERSNVVPAAAPPTVAGQSPATLDGDRAAPASKALPGLSAGVTPTATDNTPAPVTAARADTPAATPAAASFEQSLSAANAAQAGATPRTSGTRVDAPQFPVQTPAHQRGWADEVGNRMVWMAGKELGKAELVLTPPHLGRVEISLSVNGDQASAQFVAATPAAREALEQALPRLKEVMNQAGLSLSQANVSANGTHDQASRDAWRGAGRGGQAHAGGEADTGAAGLPQRVRSGVGLVDTFA